MSTPAPPVVAPPPKQSWLKKLGSVIWTAAKDVVGFLGNPKVQSAEAQVANIASLLLPAEAPIIQAFQAVMGKVFQQTVVTETAFANVANAGSQKLEAVLAEVGPELDQWVANGFPGSTRIQDATKAGLINAVVALQNDLMAPGSAVNPAPVSAPAAPTAAPPVPATSKPSPAVTGA